LRDCVCYQRYSPLNFQFGYGSLELAQADINKSSLRTVNEPAGIYKFNAAASIDIRLINSRFNDDGVQEQPDNPDLSRDSHRETLKRRVLVQRRFSNTIVNVAFKLS